MQTLLIGLQTTFREKLEWLEEAETLSLHFRGQREARAAEKAAREDSAPKSDNASDRPA